MLERCCNSSILQCLFFFNATATPEIYTTTDTLSLHDALPICTAHGGGSGARRAAGCRCAMRSEEHTSELQSPVVSSYAVFCLKKKKRERQRAGVALEWWRRSGGGRRRGE